VLFQKRVDMIRFAFGKSITILALCVTRLSFVELNQARGSCGGGLGGVCSREVSGSMCFHRAIIENVFINVKRNPLSR